MAIKFFMHFHNMLQMLQEVEFWGGGEGGADKKSENGAGHVKTFQK